MLTLIGGFSLHNQSLVTLNKQIELSDFLKHVQYAAGALNYGSFAIDEADLPLEDTFDLACYPIFKSDHVLAFSMSNGWVVIPQVKGQLNHFNSISLHTVQRTTLKEQWVREQIERLEGYLKFLKQPDSQEYMLVIVNEFKYDQTVIDVPSLRVAIKTELHIMQVQLHQLLSSGFVEKHSIYSETPVPTYI